MVHIHGLEERGEQERTVEQSAVLTDCTTLCLFVCRAALLDCVYFPEGHFTSGSLGMNGELISPTETSQSLHIYSPPLHWPLPGQTNNGTQVNCRWVWLKARPYICQYCYKSSVKSKKKQTEARGPILMWVLMCFACVYSIMKFKVHPTACCVALVYFYAI